MTRPAALVLVATLSACAHAPSAPSPAAPSVADTTERTPEPAVSDLELRLREQVMRALFAQEGETSSCVFYRDLGDRLKAESLQPPSEPPVPKRTPLARDVALLRIEAEKLELDASELEHEWKDDAGSCVLYLDPEDRPVARRRSVDDVRAAVAKTSARAADARTTLAPDAVAAFDRDVTAPLARTRARLEALAGR